MPETNFNEVKVPLPHEEATQHFEDCKMKAARQFIALWKRNKDRKDDKLYWGEEIEYTLVDLSHNRARVGLHAHEILARLQENPDGDDPVSSARWRTEYGDMMVEGVTHPPFTWSLEDILKIEKSLAWRRKEIERVAREVNPDLQVVTLSNFPLLGVPGCTSPPSEPSPSGELSKSLLCPDQATSPHPRYQAFTANFRKRKGCKVGAFITRSDITNEQRLPMDRIERLPFEVTEKCPSDPNPVPGYVYVDSQAFGACQCCVQATFMTHDLDDARFLTDQFLVLAPIFLALCASTPFLRGVVTDGDTRWPTFKQTWDDRTKADVESGAVKRSRTSANCLFIRAGIAEDTRESLNNVDAPKHDNVYNALRREGIDAPLSRHVANVLVRDPVMVFEDRLEVDDTENSDHWEHLLGTNWTTVRFKPPPVNDSSIGWRVEFRSPDVQITDFENAALVAVLRLLVDAITEEKWDLTIPMSKCEENDESAGARDAASRGTFWFRNSVRDANGEPATCSVADAFSNSSQQLIRDILSGPCGLFTRLRSRIGRLSVEGRCSKVVCETLECYMRLFERRARGELPTPARFLRNRLHEHPDYKRDAVVPESFVREVCELASRNAHLRPGDDLSELKGLLGC